MDSGSLQGVREFQNEISLAEKIPDRKSVILPVGYCLDTKLYSYWKRIIFRKGKNHVDTYDDEVFGNERVLLVYDLMHNGSLQDALLGKKCPELLDWGRRFQIALDIARGLEFLHEACVPPVVHGDIKPSNVLLDLRFNAKIADFGLARVKNSDQLDEEMEEDEEEVEEEEVVVKIDNLVCDESSSPNKRKEEEVASDVSAIVVAIDKLSDEASTSEFIRCNDGMSVGSEKETPCSSNNTTDIWNNNNNKERCRKMGASSVGKDWWWRQDNNVGANTDSVGGGGGGGVKDYVMEWIRSEIKKERPKSDWISTPVVSSEDCLPKSLGWSERKKQQRRLEWWVSLDEERMKKENKKSTRPAREWWREEFCEELTRKHERKKRMVTKSRSSLSAGDRPHWWEEDDQDRESSRSTRRKNKRDSCELKRTITGRRNRDWTNVTEIPKSGGACTVSSTPSMRGTVCYTAPEYGGGEPISEKCDVYSFGVLLLVLISGRRPLQVTASPMSEFERANLISWARHLAQSGRVLELVDPSVKGLDKEQALLCITVALLCIQRSPLNRPCISEIVQMLSGQSEAPHLPFEFSPSPPGGFLCKSRKRGKVS